MRFLLRYQQEITQVPFPDTPWTVDHDANYHTLTNLARVSTGAGRNVPHTENLWADVLIANIAPDESSDLYGIIDFITDGVLIPAGAPLFDVVLSTPHIHSQPVPFMTTTRGTPFGIFYGQPPNVFPDDLARFTLFNTLDLPAVPTEYLLTYFIPGD